jgi:hypothetical protein
LFFTEVMDVAHAVPSAPPIEQVIPRIDLRRAYPDRLPGLDAFAQAGTIEELPVGVNKSPKGRQKHAHLVGNLSVKLFSGEMVQYGESQDEVKLAPGQLSIPVRGGQIRGEEDELLSWGLAEAPLGLLDQDSAEVQAHIVPAVLAASELASQFPVAAAQIEYVRLWVDALDHALHPRLEALTGG